MAEQFPSERLYTVQLSSSELQDVKVSIEEHQEDKKKTDITVTLFDKIDDANDLRKEDEDLAIIAKVSKEVTVAVRRKLIKLRDGEE